MTRVVPMSMLSGLLYLIYLFISISPIHGITIDESWYEFPSFDPYPYRERDLATPRAATPRPNRQIAQRGKSLAPTVRSLTGRSQSTRTNIVSTTKQTAVKDENSQSTQSPSNKHSVSAFIIYPKQTLHDQLFSNESDLKRSQNPLTDHGDAVIKLIEAHQVLQGPSFTGDSIKTQSSSNNLNDSVKMQPLQGRSLSEVDNLHESQNSNTEDDSATKKSYSTTKQALQSKSYIKESDIPKNPRSSAAKPTYSAVHEKNSLTKQGKSLLPQGKPLPHDDLRCPPCERIHCSPRRTSKLDCRGGITKGVCNCCPVCARLEGERCGGHWGYLGRCDEGLVCDTTSDNQVLALGRGDMGSHRGAKYSRDGYKSGTEEWWLSSMEGICRRGMAVSDQPWKGSQELSRSTRSKCLPACTAELCLKNPKQLCSAVHNADTASTCPGREEKEGCRHTSCRACRLVQPEDRCSRVRCSEWDFECLKRYGRCVHKSTCDRRVKSCRAGIEEDKDAKFLCSIPDC